MGSGLGAGDPMMSKMWSLTAGARSSARQVRKKKCAVPLREGEAQPDRHLVLDILGDSVTRKRVRNTEGVLLPRPIARLTKTQH